MCILACVAFTAPPFASLHIHDTSATRAARAKPAAESAAAALELVPVAAPVVVGAPVGLAVLPVT